MLQHAKLALALGNDEDTTHLKFQGVKDMKSAGLDVAHAIPSKHRKRGDRLSDGSRLDHA